MKNAGGSESNVPSSRRAGGKDGEETCGKLDIQPAAGGGGTWGMMGGSACRMATAVAGSGGGKAD